MTHETRPKAKRWIVGTFALAAAGCGGTAPTTVASLEVDPPSTLAVGVGSTVPFVALARDVSGSPIPLEGVAWHSDDEGVATVGSNGVAVAVSSGIARIVASMEGVEGSATLEVWVPEDVSEFVPGTSYTGRRGYVEYIPGDLPVVISAPHGGDMTPAEIPDRTWGTLVTDSNTRETVLAVRDAFVEQTGSAPHVVISHLKRTKLDPNREIGEAAQESPFAENAWHEFHHFIEVAEGMVDGAFGGGLYLDLHGHGHPNNWVELGYLLSAPDLDQPDQVLNGPTYVDKSAIRVLARSVEIPFSQLLRGSNSFGGRLAALGVRSVPSPDDPSPGAEAYFSGGYNTARHGSRSAGRVVSGIQLELPRPGVRDSDGNRRLFASRLATVAEAYLTEHFGFFHP
jgi:hypothetical protein